MKTISVSEFRGNIKKYLDIAQEEKLIIHRGKGKTYAIVPIEEMEDEPYNPEFVAKIMRAREDSKQGRVTVIKTEDLWK
jgi:PHD/YefM family antitoxin component YafN of YafNO toxin-antitoxin module